jgi:hypothetical protein
MMKSTPESIFQVADAMVALGFLEREADRYAHGPVAATFLSGQTPADLRPLLHFWNEIVYPAWMQLEAAVRTGQVAVGQLNEPDEEHKRLISEGVEALTAGTALALASSYDFGFHQRLLDLGGGTGSFLQAVLRRYGGLRAILFEVPVVAAIARQRLGSSPVAGQVEVVEGDFFQDSIPQGHDVVLIANVIYLLSPQHTLELLRRTRERVVDGARLLLVVFWTDVTHTQPTFAALMAGLFLLITARSGCLQRRGSPGMAQPEWLAVSGAQTSGWACQLDCGPDSRASMNMPEEE